MKMSDKLEWLYKYKVTIGTIRHKTIRYNNQLFFKVVKVLENGLKSHFY